MEPYDFADFDIDVDAEQVALDAIETCVRRTLRDAFRAYLNEGEWTLDRGRIAWDMAWELLGEAGVGDKPYWGDRMPIELSLGPVDFVEAHRLWRDIGKDYSRGEIEERKGERLKVLDAWQRALDEARQIVAGA